MTLTAAMEEAYAASPHGEVIIETLELNHATFAAPVRIARGVDADISLPLVLNGTPVLFTAMAFMVTLPGQSTDGPSGMRLNVNDVTGALTPYLQAAVLSTTPIEITYRAYTTTDLREPGDVFSRLFLQEVNQDAMGVEGQIGFQEIEQQAFPLMTYDQQYYPMLQNP